MLSRAFASFPSNAAFVYVPQIDQALVLFGRPSSVYAHVENSRSIGPADLDDNFIVHFYYTERTIPLTVILKAGSLSLLDCQLRYSVRTSFHGHDMIPR